MMKICSLFLLITSQCCMTTATLNDPCRRNRSTEIHIIGFFPCTDPNDTRGIPVDNCDGIERIPIMKLALEEINERCDLLPGYRLVVDYANSACSSIPATYHLIQQTDPSQPTKLMILGPSCSVATYLMGEIAQRKLNIPQVAYTASDSVFGIDKQRYPRFYRLVSITEQVIDGYVALVKELNWQRVAIISYNDDFNRHLLKYSEEQMGKNNVHVILTALFVDDPSFVLNQIKKNNARIVIAWIAQHIAVEFWCTVISYRLVGPDFVWLIPGWLRTNQWAAVDSTGCTADEISKALEHSLGGRGNSVVDNDPTRMLVSYKNVKQFKQELDSKSATESVKLDKFLNIGYVYDAVWTVALALNSSISMLEERGLGRLEDFTYDSAEMADVFTEAIAATSFEGISGKVSFEKNGNRINPSIQLLQYRDGRAIPVLSYKPSGNITDFYNISRQGLLWQGGHVPRDAPIQVVVTSTTVEYVITGVASSIGILSSLFFFVFNLYHNSHPAVKRSSYRLNSLILVAVFVGFIGTLLYVIKLDPDMSETFTTTVCNVRAWTSELAFTVAFGTLSVKIWRLYKVFCNKKMVPRKCLDDRYLFAIIAIITTPILMIVIVNVAAFPLRLLTTSTVNANDFSTVEISSECSGSHEVVFLALAYTKNTILALFSMAIAYVTQKNVPKIGDFHKYHESAVINLTTMSAILLSSVCKAVFIILRLNKVRDGILLVVTLHDCLWMYPMICLLFVPKIYRVYFGPSSNDRHKEQTLAASRPSLSASRGSSFSIMSDRSQPSYQSGRRHSGTSIVSHRRSSSEMGSKREATLSPIHEHREDVYNIPMLGSLDNTTTIVEQDEGDEVATKHSEQVAIKLARCSKDDETTNVGGSTITQTTKAQQALR